MKQLGSVSIDRVHLLLPQGRQRVGDPHVTIVNAPPGFGKTRLLKEIAATAIQQGLRVASASDCDQLRSALARPRRSTREALWLLDDLVPGTAPGLIDTIADAIEHGWSVIAATRHRSLANLVAVRLPDRHRLVDETVMRLTDAELADLTGGALTSDELDRLARLTGRWPTGVRLLSAGNGAALRDDLDRISGRVAALTTSYFDSLQPYLGVKELGLAALVADMDRVSSGMIGDVFESCASDIIAALKTLSGAGAFVSEEIGAESVFSFQPMFAEYLRHRTPSVELSRSAITQACIRLAQMGHARAALRLAPMVGDTGVAREIATALGGMRLPMTAPGKLMRYHASHVSSAFDALDLTLSNMYSKLLHGQTAEAAQLMRNLESSAARCSTLDQAKTAIARLIFLYHHGAPLSVEHVTDIERQYTAALEAEPFLRALLAHLRSTAYYRRGRYTHSLGALAHVREASELLGAPLLDAYRLLSVGLTQFHMGHLHGAADSLRLAITMVQESFGSGSPQAAYNSLLLSHVLSALGEHTAADALWDKHEWAIDLYPGWREGLEVTLASLFRRTFRAHGVLHTLEAIDSWEASRSPEVRANFACRAVLFRAEAEIRASRFAAARAQLESAATEHSCVGTLDELMIAILRVRVGIELGEATLDQVRRIVAAALDCEDVFAQFSALLAEYRHHSLSGQESHAVAALTRVAALAQRHHLHAALSEEWARVEKRHREQLPAGDERAFLDGMDRDLSCNRVGEVESGLDALSARENQVLGFLQQGMSSKEIAVLLNISAGSVQGYRRRLYKKLGAHHRSQVVQAARRHTGHRSV